jgi:hypothetical protein
MTLLDSNLLTSAWYSVLIEITDRTTGNVSYQWTQPQYLSNWDALNLATATNQYSPASTQEGTTYQWDGTTWRSITGQ